MRTDSSCCASYTHTNMSLIKWTEFLSQYCCSPTCRNMGGFLPKPVSKVSWTEVFKADVIRAGAFQRLHGIPKKNKTSGEGERWRWETLKQENYFPIPLNSHGMWGLHGIILDIKYLTDTCGCRCNIRNPILSYFSSPTWIQVKDTPSSKLSISVRIKLSNKSLGPVLMVHLNLRTF